VYLRLFLIFLLVAFAARAIARLVAGMTQGMRGGPTGRSRGETPVKMAQDPVCGTFVVPGKALSTTAEGATLWFCSEHCRTEFARRH
jgi:YHS domain-containing protein